MDNSKINKEIKKITWWGHQKRSCKLQRGVIFKACMSEIEKCCKCCVNNLYRMVKEAIVVVVAQLFKIAKALS